MKAVISSKAPKKRKTEKQQNSQKIGGYKTVEKDQVTSTNPLLHAQTDFISRLPKKLRENFFCTSTVDPETRAEIWANQAELGEVLVNRYSWSTPDKRAIRILSHYQPIVEVGAGSNAYWARMMKKEGIDVTAFDARITDGGKIKTSESKKMKSRKEKSKVFDDGFVLHFGNPAILSDPAMKDKTLFLCYPDEDIMESVGDSGAESMGAACLEHFQGEYVIHVGEIFGDCLSMDQAPWGRSSGPQFQERLASEFHCILRVGLQNWLHVRDTLSVWKRTKTCTIVFAGEGDDGDSDEEIEYKFIPMDEFLPTDLAASCVPNYLLNQD